MIKTLSLGYIAFASAYISNFSGGAGEAEVAVKTGIEVRVNVAEVEQDSD